MHYTLIRRANRGAFILCQGHYDILPAAEQARYAPCASTACGTTARDCERCDDEREVQP